MTDDRQFPPRPIVGVGAVVVDGARVLLIKRGRPPLMGAWSLPGGAVEVGETLIAALQREVLEETGLVVSVGPIIEVLDRITTDGDGRVTYHYVLVDYVCVPIGGNLTCGSDALDARWADADGLEPFELSAITVAVIEKAMARASEGEW